MNKISRSALALFLTASLAVSFAACAPVNTDGDGDAAPSGSAEVSGTDTETPELPPNTFRLNRLPDIGKYSEKNEIYTRLSEKLIDTLDPRKDYGTLVPFVGSKKDYKIPGSNDDEDSFYFGEEMSYGKYGLCTLGGMIVLDAVYDEIYPVYDRSGETCGYYSALKCYDVDAENQTRKTQTYLIKSDGSAVYDIGGYSLMNVSDEGYTVYNGDIMTGNHIVSMYFGFDGKLRASTPDTAEADGSSYSYGNIGYFAKNGLANVVYSEYNGDDSFDIAYYIDKDGNTVIEGLRDAMPFSDYGIAVAGIASESTDEDGTKYRSSVYGLINSKGEWVIAPEYDYIDTSENHSLVLLKKGSDVYLADTASESRIADSIRVLVPSEEDNPYGVTFCGKGDEILCFQSRLDGSCKYEYLIDPPAGINAIATARRDDTTGLFMVRSKELDVNANVTGAYGEDIFLCYDFDTKKATFIDRNGDTIVTYENITNRYYNTLGERFLIVPADEEYKSRYVYDLREEKSLGIFSGFINSSIGERYLTVYESDENDPNSGSLSVYDADAGEYIMKGLETTYTFSVDGKEYTQYSDGNYLYTADADFNTIIKLREKNED